jgi:O-acetyl-ADP-ribose deacetylase (regulator of RNase III)
MVQFKDGSIFESKAQTITNAVNCVGVMGKGIALDFKNRFPEMFSDYSMRCKDNQVNLGKPYLYKSASLPWILNFPTKKHWKQASNMNCIVDGLRLLRSQYEQWGITSLAIPALGCGLGGLSWEEVAPILFDFGSNVCIPVEIYVPLNSSAELCNTRFKIAPKNTLQNELSSGLAVNDPL